MRASRDRVVIQEFTGVNDLIDVIRLPPNLVPWSHGGHFNERSEFERLRGKLHLAASTSSRGMILTLVHAKYSNHDVVLVHDYETYRAYGSIELVPLRTQEDDVNPLNPFL